MHPKIEEKQREIIEAFNSKPKNGIEKIKELLKDEENIEVEKEIAEFFIKQKKNLDLEAVGDYLSGPEPENNKVLKEFADMLDLKGQSFTEGLRTFLKAFKLPGEAQKIDRLVQSFSETYCKQNPGVIAKADDAYVLAFQAIMLNTDAHNPSIANKMTLDGLIRNLRGCNDGKDFDPEFLEQMYNDIQGKPFELNFVKTDPGYELNSSTLNNDPTFEKMNLLLKSKTTAQDTFPGIGPDVKATIDKPKSWLHSLIGYEGTITLKDETTKAEANIQVYKPGFFSKWLFGEQPKVIIQPVHKDGSDPKASIDLAAKIAAGFKSDLNSIKATYDYEKDDLSKAYQENRMALQTDASRKFSDTYKREVAEPRAQEQLDQEQRDKPQFS